MKFKCRSKVPVWKQEWEEIEAPSAEEAALEFHFQHVHELRKYYYFNIEKRPKRFILLLLMLRALMR